VGSVVQEATRTRPPSRVGVGWGPTFLIMLAPVVLAGLLLMLRGARSYPRDVATAMAAEDRTGQER